MEESMSKSMRVSVRSCKATRYGRERWWEIKAEQAGRGQLKLMSRGEM